MEIRTAFEVLVGILMMVTILIAAIVILQGTMKGSTFIYECKDASYITTDTTGNGQSCGFNSGVEVHCKSGAKIDNCLDESKNLCCPRGIDTTRGKCCELGEVK
jgi:hypothetical protein